MRSPKHDAAIRLMPDLEGVACVYCGEPATTRDHVVPWTRGGEHSPDNLVPACGRCNGSKGTMTPDEWLAAGLYRTAACA